MIMEEKETLGYGVKTIFQYLWPSLKPFRKSFALGFVLILFTTLVETLLPIVMGKAVDAATSSHAEKNPLFLAVGVYLGLIVGKSVLETFQSYVIQSAGEGVTHELRRVLFSKIQSLQVAYFDKNPTGRLLTRVVNDIKSLSEMFTASFSVLALDFMIIVGTMVAMFWVHAKLAAVVLFSFPLVVFIIHYYGKKLSDAYRVVRKRLSEINAFLGENIGAISTIQRLAVEEERNEKFQGIVFSHESAQMQSLYVFARVQPLTNVVNGVATGMLLAVGGYWVIQEQMSLGILVAFLGYLRNLFQPVRDLVEKYNTFLSSMMSAERVVSILAEPSEVEPAHQRGSLREVTFLLLEQCGIEFRNVSFSYPLRSKPALDNVSFSVPAGKSLAIVGATGSGKSTIIRLLLKFYEIQKGEIVFAGRSLARWEPQDLRRHLGVIQQEVFLFQGTVRENLTLGRTGFLDGVLRSACEKAQLWGFIEARGGLDMNILEGGTNLSLGERQLLAFARILVFDPKVLILDEATASIDRVLEKRLMSAMHEVLSGRTSLVIAHRLSTIRECDQVVVMENGRLIERGTYEGLLDFGGVFEKFHSLHSVS